MKTTVAACALLWMALSLAPMPATAQQDDGFATPPPAAAVPDPMALTAQVRDFRARRARPLQDATAYAKAVLPFAALAHEVYCNDLYERRSAEQVASQSASCRLETPEVGRGWRHLRSYAGDRMNLPGSGSGLRMAVYFSEKGPQDPVLLGVAFRGTDFTSWDDWHSNLRWFLPGIDQYDAVAALAEQVIGESQQAVRELLGRDVARWQIVTTGHSLGGGLAQLFAYKSKQVNGAVVFDPSPVTGYYSCVSREETNCNVPVWRVYQRGEVLSYVRGLTRQFYSLSENITELEFDLLDGDAVNRHGMSPFYLQLRAAALKAGSTAPGEADLFARRLDCTCLRERKLHAEYELVRAQCEALALERDGPPPPIYSGEVMVAQAP